MRGLTFRDRRDAGRQLAERLRPYVGTPDLVVLALPRGGVPVAFEVASLLGAPLDVCVVRKLGVPGNDEVAMGAITSGGVELIDQRLVRALHLTPEQVHHTLLKERRELARRELAYRGDRPPVQLRGRTVLLVDDGLATGASMLVAVTALRQQDPRAIVVAVPVAPASTCAALGRAADACVCVETPEPFGGVGQWYADFRQTSDAEVRALLRDAEAARGAASDRAAPATGG